MENGNKPLILEIKANSLDDGPGIRSVVFFKGCPLSCTWCHNPESKRIGEQISYAKKACIRCGICIKTCKRNAISFENPFFIDRRKCNLCYECVKKCPTKALTRVGYHMTADEIVNKVIRDKPFYDASGGGVTLSGGEVTLHMEFVCELLKKLKEKGIHTLIETCGQFDINQFRDLLLPYIDIIYYDIKIFDSEKHKKYCGVSNEIISNNFKILFELSKQGNFEILPRTPLIPNISDTDANMDQTAEFLSSLGVKKSELLPYNPTWFEKAYKIGLNKPMDDNLNKKWQDSEKLKRCKSFYIKRGIEV